MTPRVDPARTAPSHAQDPIDFPELWNSLHRYKWGVLGIALLVALTTTVIVYSMTPYFRATLTLLIEPKSERVVKVEEVYDPGFGTIEYFGTQYELLRSRDLAGMVVDRLNLVTNPDFIDARKPAGADGAPHTRAWRDWLSFLSGTDKSVSEESQPPDPAELREQAINTFLDRLEIEPVFRTQLVKVHIESQTPQLAASMANALGEAFLESGLESRLQITQKATRWLTEKLSDIRTKLEQSERALQTFRESQHIVDAGGAKSLLEDELLDSTRRLREAERKKTELASTYWKIQQAGNDDHNKLEEISALLIDPLVQQANSNLLNAREALKQLEERYGELHPQMAAARARYEGAQKAYRERLRNSADGVKAEYEIARETEKALTDKMNAAKEELRRLNRKDYELGVLEREVQTNRQLYELFLTRFKETDTAGSYENVNARVVDEAILPKLPYRPNKRRAIVLSALAGLFLGTLLAILRHLLQEGVRSVEELEAATGLPVLGLLPKVDLPKKESLAGLFHSQPKTPFAEGVRSIRASLQLSDIGKPCKCIMVTSSVPEEGKSSIASSLALACAAMEKTLLVEADLRAPSIRKMMGIPGAQPGWAELLAGQVSLNDCIYHSEQSRLSVLSVRLLPPNPAEFISSPAFHKLVDHLREHYDRVIFDTPPWHVAADSQVLSHLVDAVIFVVKADATRRKTIRAAVKQLRQGPAHVLGAVINQVDVRRDKSYYDSHYYAYGYYSK